MRFNSRKMVSGALLAAVAGLTSACGEGLEPQELAAEDSAAALRTQEEAVAREAGRQLTQALARSLRDPSMRGLIRAAMAETLVKEDKVHFNSYVRGSGRALLQAMSRQSGLSVAQLDSLLTQAGSLEMYLPVQEHRAAWRGGDDLLVATQYRDHETPIGFDLAGNPVLMSAEAPPATPTLVLVPAEDFDAEGVPSARGLALGRGGQSQEQVQAMGEVSAAYTAWTGAWVNYVYIPGDYEAWARGSPEYEMFMERTESSRQKIRCAGEGSATPFRWNMDGTSYSSPFLIAWEGETPNLDGLAMHIWEDDDTQCVIKEGKDYLKLTMDALKNSYNFYKATQKKDYGQAALYFYHAFVAFKSIISGNDEYVGTVTGNAQVSATEELFILKDANTNTTGHVKLQWTTRYY
jgi:hypothetical protein